MMLDGIRPALRQTIPPRAGWSRDVLWGGGYLGTPPQHGWGLCYLRQSQSGRV